MLTLRELVGEYRGSLHSEDAGVLRSLREQPPTAVRFVFYREAERNLWVYAYLDESNHGHDLVVLRGSVAKHNETELLCLVESESWSGFGDWSGGPYQRGPERTLRELVLHVKPAAERRWTFWARGLRERQVLERFEWRGEVPPGAAAKADPAWLAWLRTTR